MRSGASIRGVHDPEEAREFVRRLSGSHAGQREERRSGIVSHRPESRGDPL